MKSCMVPRKRQSDLILCKTRMKGAGGNDIGTIGAFVACLEATTKDGKVAHSKQLAYVCEKVTNKLTCQKQ